MRYLVIESFKNQDPVPVYRRARDRGRMTPDGLVYVDSWIDTELSRCFQLMECEDPALLEGWMAAWRDLVNFEVIEVLSSEEVMTRLADRL